MKRTFADGVANVGFFVAHDEEDQVSDRQHREADGAREDREPERQLDHDAEHTDGGKHRAEAEGPFRVLESAHFGKREAADDHVGGDRAAGHSDQTEVENDASGRTDEVNEDFGGFERFQTIAQNVASVDAADRHADHDEGSDQHERDEHRHSEVPFRERFVVRTPAFRQEGVRIEERHVNADRRTEHTEYEDQVFGIFQDLCGIQPAEAAGHGDPVDLAEIADDDDAEGKNDEENDQTKEVFVDLNAKSASAVAPDGHDIDEEDRQTRAPRDAVRSSILKSSLTGGGHDEVFHRAGSETILREVPDDRRRKRTESPEEDEQRTEETEFTTKRLVRFFLFREDDFAQRGEHTDAQEHGERLDPEQFVSEGRTSDDAGRGTSGSQRHGTLKQPWSGTLNVSANFRKERTAVQFVQGFDLFLQFLRVPFRRHRQALAFIL